MARIASLNVLLSTTGKDYLAEQYGAVIANVQKNCISQALKNTALSGTPGAGTYEAKRFENKTSNAYGTARTGGAGQAVKATPVTVAVNVDKEIVVEVEQKDITLYGVDNLVEREAASAEKSMTRELEKAFFAEAVNAGTAYTPAQTVTAIEDIIEGLIQSVETVQNDFVDGVERDMIAVVCNPATFGKLRTYVDKVNDGGAQPEAYALFHGVKVYSSVYLPNGTNAVAMAEGSIAQPVLPTIAPAERIQLSNAIAFGLFYSYGTKAVAADLIFKY
jgi:hypothetical protein